MNVPGFDEPPTSLTTTATGPGVLYAGSVAVIWVADTTTTFVASTPPNVTVDGVTKPVPVIVTLVPPAVGPSAGATPSVPAMVGAAS